MIDKEFVHHTGAQSQKLLEEIINNNAYHHRHHHQHQKTLDSVHNGITADHGGSSGTTSFQRRRIVKILECANDIRKDEITDIFFVPILRETSIEYIIQKVLDTAFAASPIADNGDA